MAVGWLQRGLGSLVFSRIERFRPGVGGRVSHSIVVCASPVGDLVSRDPLKSQVAEGKGFAPQDCVDSNGVSYPVGTIIGCQMCALLAEWMGIPCNTAPSCQC
jgi:hypothetical protein